MRIIRTAAAATGLVFLIVATGSRAGPETATIDIAPFERNIATIERDGGALDDRLSEQYLSMGLAYRANGDTANAIEAFQQALHVNRINKGLHHLVHVPIVDLLIACYADYGDWKAVDRFQRFRYWIYRREADGAADEFATAAMAFAAWETRAHDLDTGVATYPKLRDALDALDTALTIVTANGGDDDPRLLDILNAQAQAYLNIAAYVSTTEEDFVTGGVSSDNDFSDAIERRNILIESYIRGKGDLERVVKLTDNATMAVAHALAIANLADWELAFDRSQNAGEIYRRAYQALVAAGASEDELQREFGSPRRLAGFSIEPREPAGPSSAGDRNAFVAASFDVTKQGTVRNIKVVSAKPSDNSQMVRRARDTLRETRFRPSIDATGPIETNTTIRYVFPDISI